MIVREDTNVVVIEDGPGHWWRRVFVSTWLGILGVALVSSILSIWFRALGIPMIGFAVLLIVSPSRRVVVDGDIRTIRIFNKYAWGQRLSEELAFDQVADVETLTSPNDDGSESYHTGIRLASGRAMPIPLNGAIERATAVRATALVRRLVRPGACPLPPTPS